MPSLYTSTRPLEFLVPILVALVLAASVPTVAQVEAVTVRIDGMACVFCANTLEKNLAGLKGFGDLSIDINKGSATLVPGRGGAVDVDGLRSAVRKAGFTPREVTVRATGRIDGSGAHTLLVSGDGATLFRLMQGETLSAAVVEPGGIYGVRGVIVPPQNEDAAGGPPWLEVTGIAPSGVED